MKNAEEWDNYFATTESTYRQKGESLWAWHARRYKMIQDDAHNTAVRECAEKAKGWDTVRKAILTLIKPN